MEKFLSIYERKGKFNFKPSDSLKEVCNAPTDSSGIYLVYGYLKHKKPLFYIGISGKIQEDGKMFIRKAGLGELKIGL